MHISCIYPFHISVVSEICPTWSRRRCPGLHPKPWITKPLAFFLQALIPHLGEDSRNSPETLSFTQSRTREWPWVPWAAQSSLGSVQRGKNSTGAEQVNLTQRCRPTAVRPDEHFTRKNDCRFGLRAIDGFYTKNVHHWMMLCFPSHNHRELFTIVYEGSRRGDLAPMVI